MLQKVDSVKFRREVFIVIIKTRIVISFPASEQSHGLFRRHKRGVSVMMNYVSQLAFSQRDVGKTESRFNILSIDLQGLVKNSLRPFDIPAFKRRLTNQGQQFRITSSPESC